MHDQDVASLAAYHASLDKLADLQGHFNEYLAQARVAERVARALCAEARSELKKMHDLGAAAAVRDAEELSPTP